MPMQMLPMGKRTMIGPFDHCLVHAEPCDCPAYLIVMGHMDLYIERMLEEDPAFAEVIRSRLARAQEAAV